MNTVETNSLALLWNNSSGWHDSDKTRRAIESILSSDDSHLTTHQVTRGMDICKESKSIAASGADILIAAGGDGTINAAASALIHKSTALGVIPAGTLNHFARDLQIPLQPLEAARIIAEGKIIQIDAASVNDRIFINNSVLGLFPNYRTAREAWERHGFGTTRIGRLIAIIAAVLKVFWRLPHLVVSLDFDGRKRTMRTPFVLIGNNEHEMQGLGLGHRQSIDNGQLWVYVMRPCSRWQLLRLLFGLILGKAPRNSIFQVFPASRLTIDSKRRRLGVGIDGEMLRMKTPLEYKSLPGALNVVVPRSYSSQLPDAK
jgi:diacylglycerol kinase family enzyme